MISVSCSPRTLTVTRLQESSRCLALDGAGIDMMTTLCFPFLPSPRSIPGPPGLTSSLERVFLSPSVSIADMTGCLSLFCLSSAEHHRLDDVQRTEIYFSHLSILTKFQIKVRAAKCHAESSQKSNQNKTKEGANPLTPTNPLDGKAAVIHYFSISPQSPPPKAVALGIMFLAHTI